MTDIVLTADRTLMTDYNGISPLGHIGCVPNRLVPNFVIKQFLPELFKGEATYSLRRVESQLLAEGYDVKIINPQELNKIKKLNPKVVGVSTVDPLTKKPHPWTLTNIFGGGESVIQNKFFKLLIKLKKIKRNHPFNIIIGGPGATEFKKSEEYNNLFDTVVIGPGEGAVDLFKQAMKKKKLPKIYNAKDVPWKDIPLIKGPARLGHVQITQGCPRGCQFCVPTLKEWISFPKQRILNEIETNLKGGIKQVSLITEDFFLYRSKEVETNHSAILNLMKSITELMRKHEAYNINFSNLSIASTIKGKKTCKALTDLLNLSEERPTDTIIGLETGSPRLIKKYMKDKAKPYDPDNWRELVIEGINILNDNHWHPLLNLITGLPDENEKDVIQTLELIDDLKENNVFYYVFYFVPLEGCELENQNFFSFDDISERRWELFIKCWSKTIQWLQQNMKKKIDIENRILWYLFIKMLKEVEKELKIYKNDPFGFRDTYAYAKIKGIHLIPFLLKRYVRSNEPVNK